MCVGVCVCVSALYADNKWFYETLTQTVRDQVMTSHEGTLFREASVVCWLM